MLLKALAEPLKRMHHLVVQGLVRNEPSGRFICWRLKVLVIL
jgi:hypothetical protein